MLKTTTTLTLLSTLVATAACQDGDGDGGGEDDMGTSDTEGDGDGEHVCNNDGEIQGDEECDDGNDLWGDRCTPLCTDPCGNDIVEVLGELCLTQIETIAVPAGPVDLYYVPLIPGPMDIGVISKDGGKLTVLEGDNMGAFADAGAATLGTEPLELSTGIAGGMNLNILAAAVNKGSGDVSVLPAGNVLGGSPTNIAVASDLRAIEVGQYGTDFYGDVAVVSAAEKKLYILDGLGLGQFQLRNETYAVGAGPSSITRRDVGGDEAIDLMVTNTDDGTISILIADGNGSFADQVTMDAGPAPTHIAFGDFDIDGDEDMVTTNPSDGSVALLEFDQGDWGTPDVIAVGTEPTDLVVTDINGDGTHDLVIADAGADQVIFMLGDGESGWRAPLTRDVGTAPVSLIIDDFDEDGGKDLATADRDSDTVTILRTDI